VIEWQQGHGEDCTGGLARSSHFLSILAFCGKPFYDQSATCRESGQIPGVWGSWKPSLLSLSSFALEGYVLTDVCKILFAL